MSETVSTEPALLISTLETHALQVGGRAYREGRRDNFAVNKDFGEKGDLTGDSILFSARRERNSPGDPAIAQMTYILTAGTRITLDALPGYVEEVLDDEDAEQAANTENPHRFERFDTEQYSLALPWYGEGNNNGIIEISREREYRVAGAAVYGARLIKGKELTGDCDPSSLTYDRSEWQSGLIVAEQVFAQAETPPSSGIDLDMLLTNPDAFKSRVELAAARMYELLNKFLED